LTELIEYFSSKTIKGEIVIVLEGFTADKGDKDEDDE